MAHEQSASSEQQQSTLILAISTLVNGYAIPRSVFVSLSCKISQALLLLVLSQVETGGDMSDTWVEACTTSHVFQTSHVGAYTIVFVKQCPSRRKS